MALDLATGETALARAARRAGQAGALPLPLQWGTPTSGGPIVTAGGLVFIGATMDERFRAFDVETGEELWETATPTAAMATPMTYEWTASQFVAVAAGGHMWQYSFKIGDSLIAWRLGERLRPDLLGECSAALAGEAGLESSHVAAAASLAGL